MNFIEYNLIYYKERLEFYESLKYANEETVHEAKLLHKLVADMENEGQTDPTDKMYYEALENSIQAKTRLERFILKNGERPIKTDEREISYEWGNECLEFDDYFRKLQNFSTTPNSLKTEEFEERYNKVIEFSDWVYRSVPSNTAVVFLLRDTMLPYLAFKKWNKDKTIEAVPLIIGRKFLRQFGPDEELYHKIYEAVFTCLANKLKGEEFVNGAVKLIKELVFDKFPEIEKAIREIFGKINKDNIVLVETGFVGSIPLILKSADSRIKDIKLFSVYPYLYDGYEGSYCTKNFEWMMTFEYLTCQDQLFKFDSYRNGKFYVNETLSQDIKDKAYQELLIWNKIINRR